MTLTHPIIDHITANFKNNTFYIGDKIKAAFPSFCACLEKLVKCTEYEQADAIIDDEIYNFSKKIVITNIQNSFTSGYDFKVINKQNDVACYYRRKEIDNEHLLANPFLLNANDDLFTIDSKEIESKDALDITSLAGKYTDKELLIVGGGPSWQNVDYSKLSKGIIVMVINYNFSINCDFMIYTDTTIAEYLRAVKYKDDRKIIGHYQRVDGQADYFYKENAPFKQCKHTTAYALQIAQVMGFRKKYLIGCDYYRYPGNRDYCYKKLKNYTYKESGGRINAFIRDYDIIKAKDVYQLNPESRLKKYPIAKIEELYD
jgi:hypothetical protein